MSADGIIGDRIARALSAPRTTPLVVGLCGAQGSGKSTIAAALATRFAGTAVLSLDDLYLARRERLRMARTVHPLFATRGVPGTHDIPLGLDTLAAIDAGKRAALPRFDKARDDRVPEAQWPVTGGATPLVLLEGWCVGARPQSPPALIEPINALELEQDADGRWRHAVNDALAGPYQRLFARLDLLILLRSPDFAQVFAWRTEQEHALRRAGGAGVGVMSDAALMTFIRHYERLTRHILDEMPDRADLTIELDATRRCIGVIERVGEGRTDGG